ncbi:MAG TPA: 1-acyl-sn-glycerol-3-phosphate acyltransferase [Acidimicrobiia bacterium]
MPRKAVETSLQGPAGRRTVYLLDVSTGLEERILRSWLSRQVKRAETVRISSSRRGRGGDDDNLEQVLASSDDPYLIPLRVVWMAPERDGNRSVDWTDIFKPGDPRDPRGLRAWWTLLFNPSRVVRIAGAGAPVSELRRAYEEADDVDGLAPFVTRRAWRALDVEEREILGNRYKVPRFVPEAILSRRSFRESIAEAAETRGIDPDAAMRLAERHLDEIAATHSPYVIDIIANLIHALYKQGYGRIRYHTDQVRRVAALGQDHPVVFLPSHRSNLDRLTLQYLLWENDLPANHTAGGNNLDFFPVGPLMRRTGVFFIRRSFKDDEIYKRVLRAYIDFLIEKRFNLEWYMEGGRSRSGRLAPPRFGLLSYVNDALRRGKADDVVLVPVSIAYDQIQDVPDYTREAQGRAKEKESIRWLVKSVRSLRKRYGDIHVRFGEPISLRSMTAGVEAEEGSIVLQKVAFEAMRRIGLATPITPIAVVSIALLAERGTARDSGQLAQRCARLLGFIHDRKLEMTEDTDLGDPEMLEGFLDWLVENGNASAHEASDRRVYWLDDTQMIQLSYYRNVVLHFFVPRAMAEMALASGAKDPDDLTERMLGLRDLLKFEFFFADREQFAGEVDADLAIDCPDWKQLLVGQGPQAVLEALGMRLSPWALLPILDAYQVVGDELERWRGKVDEKKFLAACLARGRLYRLEGRLIHGESVSQVVFKSALKLAENRGLLEDPSRRVAFAAELREARLAATGS